VAVISFKDTVRYTKDLLFKTGEGKFPRHLTARKFNICGFYAGINYALPLKYFTV
jgi:hypothetical protein